MFLQSIDSEITLQISKAAVKEVSFLQQKFDILLTDCPIRIDVDEKTLNNLVEFLNYRHEYISKFSEIESHLFVSNFFEVTVLDC